MNAREEVLARIAAALGPDAQVPVVPRAYGPAGREPPGSPVLVERFCDRVAAYAARVHRAAPGGIDDSVAAACSARGSRRLVAAPDAKWRPPGLEIVPDDVGTDPRELEQFDAALTGCVLAVAETGTIALDGGQLCGRRALTLVPDHHICIVRADQIVAGVPDAIAALADAARARQPVTLVSGPSATSDIELERVEGVHGPRLLDVIVVS
jgi:L-lactate dehydrogenase complex protein LldG